MNTKAFYALIKSAVGTTFVYPDFVPEGKDLPAVSYTHIANSNIKELKGKVAGEWDSWRIIITAKTRSDIDTLINALKALNGTSNEDYQFVSLLTYGSTPASPDDDLRAAYIDFRVYGR